MSNQIVLKTENSMNLYIEQRFLRKSESLLNNKVKFFCSNIAKRKKDVVRYLEKYVELAKVKERRFQDGRQNREGYIFYVMLPKNTNVNSSIKEIYKYIYKFVEAVSEGNDMKFIATIEKQGRAKMIRITIPMRLLVEEGVTSYVTPKIRLSHLGTKTKHSTKIFNLKMLELKELIVTIFKLTSKNVKTFIKKLTYKRLYVIQELDKYYYSYDTMYQRDAYREIKKRKLTAFNTLVEAINRHIMTLDADIDIFIQKWKNELNIVKKSFLERVEILEGICLSHIQILGESLK